MAESQFTIELVQQADYRFEAHFDNPALPALVTDEPPPLGGDAGIAVDVRVIDREGAVLTPA